MRRVLLLAAVALALGASEAKGAVPFSPAAEADYQEALIYWGAAPTCGDPTREMVPSFPGGVLGRAYPVACGIGIVEGMSDCQQNFVVRHELGHLLGFSHSDDPASPMYPIAPNCLDPAPKGEPPPPPPVIEFGRFRHNDPINHRPRMRRSGPSREQPPRACVLSR